MQAKREGNTAKALSALSEVHRPASGTNMTFGVFSRLLQVFLCHGLEGEQFSILDCESAGIKMRRDYLEG